MKHEKGNVYLNGYIDYKELFILLEDYNDVLNYKWLTGPNKGDLYRSKGKLDNSDIYIGNINTTPMLKLVFDL